MSSARVCSATGSAKSPEALVTTMSDAMTEGTRQWSMPAAEDWIQRRRPVRDGFVPRNGDLGVPQEDVGVEQFLGDAFLAGVDDFMPRSGGGQLRQVPGFHGITDDDSHAADGTRKAKRAIAVGLTAQLATGPRSTII